MTAPTPTIERLRQVFELRDDGTLYWKLKTCHKVVVGREAGGPTAQGYRAVRVDKHLMLTHRVAFAIEHGRWPNGELDHINTIKTDNRPCNLREATRFENNRNRDKGSNNTSGVKGVSFDKARGLWVAEITVNRKKIVLGRFADIDAAAAAYKAASIEHHGEFSRARHD